MFNLDIIGSSAWNVAGWGSGNIGAEIMAGGGKIILANPSRQTSDLYYGGIGVGAMAGIKLPKVGKIKLRGGGTVGPTSFPTTGIIYKTANCGSSDLVRDDFRGVCVFAELGGGLVGGGSVCGLLVGGQTPTSFAATAATTVFPPAVLYYLLTSFKAVIPLAGLNVGVQAGIGGAVYIGLAW